MKKPNKTTLQALAECENLKNVKRYSTTSKIFDAWDKIKPNTTSLRAKRSNPDFSGSPRRLTPPRDDK